VQQKIQISDEQAGKLKSKQQLLESVKQTIEVFEVYKKTEFVKEPLADSGAENKQEVTSANKETKQFSTQTS
jgi:hypothetical protein